MYSPLPSPRSIRILEIHPGALLAAVQVSLRIVDLDSSPEYEALSYCWGPKEPATDVICNGELVQVTPNLGAALRRLRLEDEVRTVWIDALCINQNDLDERAKQVSFMREIYAGARRVVVWLGSDDEFAHDAIVLIAKVWEIATRELQAYNGDFSLFPREYRQSEKKHQRDLPLPSDPAWDVVWWFYNRPWFSRIWCVQEIAQDYQAEAFIGQFTVPWKYFGVPAFWLRATNYAKEQKYFIVLSRAFTMWQLAYFKPEASALQSEDMLFSNLEKLSAFEATDPRDKVFAILGLSREGASAEIENSLIQPNYRKSVPNTYADVVRYLISQPRARESGERGKGLDILGLTYAVAQDDYQNINYPKNDDGIERFPSWVPRFDNNNRTYKSLSLKGEQHHEVVSWTPSYETNVEVSESVCPDSLVLRGIKLTKVAKKYYWGDGDFSEMIETYSPTPREFFAWLLHEVGVNLPNYGGPDTIREAFTRAITAGTIKESDLPGGMQDFHEQDLVEWLLNSPESQSSARLIENFGADVNDRLSSFALLITEDGHIGLGVPMRPGDEIWLLFGGRVLYILRPIEDHYTFIGECYVHGYMSGEGMELWKEGSLKDDWVDLW